MFSSQKYKIKTGAIPKLTKSVKESNSFPNSEVPLIILAILPSKASKIEATKISSEWYLWMHHTIDKIPTEYDNKKFPWQKEHTENKTGTEERHKPIKLNKNDIKKKYETWK